MNEGPGSRGGLYRPRISYNNYQTAQTHMAIEWQDYLVEGIYDELIARPDQARDVAKPLCDYLGALTDAELRERRDAADLAITTMGITFTVYSEGQGSIDRSWPFDIIPRIIAKTEWDRVEEGLKQRVRALNMLIDDLYHDQRVVKDKIFPKDILASSTNFRPQVMGVNPPFGVWAHICGSDLVRHSDGRIYVLEDNLRVPSGVSYMLENRQVLKRVWPEMFENYSILPVDDYPRKLRQCLAGLSPRKSKRPQVVVLTPGIYNSAYFEHSYLAQQMGAQLVEGADLMVGDDDCVYMRSIDGRTRVDVIYRRVDDLFLDPEVFSPDSMLGVSGLMRAWKKGNVALANAPGAGVADDKVVYALVPKIIKYYLDEDPIIPNVETYLCVDPAEQDFVLANLHKLVVKPANESGGYGMLIGPQASKEDLGRFRELIKANPRNYIAQPLLSLSTVPTLVDVHAEPRHVDLRPFILSGRETYVTAGGLTRVALRKGSTVVNSSQGGGSKDTWIVDVES
jgi:uncharacterized circularly permuted ATP-grasp superfamily protein